MRTLLFIILLLPQFCFAQEYIQQDTLPTRMLEEITIQTSTSEEDTLLSFVRTNVSATTEEILKRMQGAYLIRRGSYGQEPMIRGMSAGQINVTLDGMKLFGACTDKMDPVTIYVEPFNMRSMQINTGTGGSAMGSTIGGTVDMQLIQPHFGSKKITGKAGVGYQSISSGNTNYLMTNYAPRRSAYNLNINYRKALPYRAGNGEKIAYTQYKKINVLAGGKWSVGKDTLVASVLADDGWNIGYAALPMDVGYAKARIYSLTYQRTRCHGLIRSFQTKVYYNSIKHSMDDSHRKDIVMHMDMPGKSYTAGAYINGYFRRIKKHELAFRIDFYRNTSAAAMTMYPDDGIPMYMQTWPTTSRNVSGIYLSDQWSLAQNIKLKGDARVDFNLDQMNARIGFDQLTVFYPDLKATTTRTAKTMNLGLQQLHGKSFITEIKVGYGERLPALSETSGFYLFNRSDGYDYIGNPYLPNEQSFSSDITLSWFAANTQLSINGFYQHINNYFFGVPDPAYSVMTPGAAGVKIYTALPYATFAGGDITVMANLCKQFQWASSTKVLWAENNEHNPLPQIPPLTFINTLKYQYNKLITQVELESALKQERINYAFGEDATPAYVLLNARLNYNLNLLKRQTLISINVDNIFDRYYHTHLDWGNIPRPGRNITLTFEIRF